MFTARHYTAIAKVLKFERECATTIDARVAIDNTIAAFDEAFKKDNPNYNSDEFMDAVYVESIDD